MYQVKDRMTWTLGQLDWRQLGIMVFAFLNSLSAGSYHKTEPDPTSPFLKGLVQDGVYERSLYYPEDDIIG